MASTMTTFGVFEGYEISDSHSPFMEKHLWTRIIVMITCVLSMLGALLIIFSFVCCKDLRSRGRQILVNISIMDFGVGMFNLAGSAVYFDGLYHQESCENCTVYKPSAFFTPPHCREFQSDLVYCPESATVHYFCLAQACLSGFFTYGSILWTNSLCFYLYFRIVYSGTKWARYCVYASYMFCYGMPLFIILWLSMTGRLGFSPYESSGWCSIILLHPVTKEKDIFVSIFGYNLWIVLTFVFVPILSCAVHINVKNKAKNTAVYRMSDKLMLALLSIDYKFLSIPLAFILLRLWSLIADVLHLYLGRNDLNEGLSLVLIILGGIGDSGQGITNALIFIIFTKKFKDAVKSTCRKLFSSGGRHMAIQNVGEQNEAINDDVGEEKSLIDGSSGGCISPHNFTYQSYENTTPISLDI